MSALKGLFTRLTRSIRRRRFEDEMAAEMQAHIELETERRIALGESPATARRRAAAEFGSVDARTEEVRDARLSVWLEQLWQDFVFAFRQLRKSRAFTGVAILTLTLGIGANTAIFSVVNAMLLRSLPVPNPEQLRILKWTGEDVSLNNFTGSGFSVNGRLEANAFPHATFEDFRDSAADLGDVFGFFPVRGQATGAGGEVGISDVLMVSGNYFNGMQVSAQIGRVFAPADDLANAAPVAVITHGLWQTRYAADPDILGATISINRHKFSIIGVMPVDYAAPFPGEPIDVYVPLAAQPLLQPYRALQSYDNWWIRMMVRLHPERTNAQLHTVLRSRLEHTLDQSSTRANKPDVLIQDGRAGIVPNRGAIAPRLFALQGIVGVILLIACANLAGLLLARATVRRREFAICAAIGAQRLRLMRRLLVESFLLAAGGGAGGFWFGALLKNGMLRYLPTTHPGLELDLTTDGNVMLFAVAVTVATALLCGLLPAFRASRTDLVTDLQTGRTCNITRHRLGRALVIIQIALSVLLMTGAGLFVRSLDNLRAVETGFDSQNLLIFRLNADQEGYADEQRLEFFDQAQENLSRIPGVTSVTASNIRLLSGSMASSGFHIPGREPRPDERMQAYTMVVADDYFETLNIGLQRGRAFGPQDHVDSEPVTVINALLAERHFPGQLPIDQTLRMGGTNYRIIGVCGTTLYDDVKSEPPMTMFTSARQNTPPAMDFYIRSALPATAIIPAARKEITALDPSIPLANISTLEAQFDSSIAIERSFAMLFGSLGGLAVLLSCIGLYGLMTYSTNQRRAEIGIRMALGALPGEIARKVLSESLLLTIWGLLMGLPLAIGLGFMARAAFFDVTPFDPFALLGTILALASASAVAVWLPARRAAHIDVLSALRSE